MSEITKAIEVKLFLTWAITLNFTYNYYQAFRKFVVYYLITWANIVVWASTTNSQAHCLGPVLV